MLLRFIRSHSVEWQESVLDWLPAWLRNEFGIPIALKIEDMERLSDKTATLALEILQATFVSPQSATNS